MSSSKSTDFRGRLGYACLNTVLRAQKPSIYSSRTCRLDTIKTKGLNFVKGLAMANVRDIEPMLRWNETHHIRFLRLSSDMFPFMSHAELGYPIDFAETELRRIGQLANTLGHRLTFHPGQFNQLGSPSAKVIDNSLWELDQHAQILDFMHMPADSVMIIHMGGMYGSKSDTLERFAANFRRLSPSAQARLVLENDEICYSVADLMPLCERLSIPLVLDWHHDDINPSPEPPESYLPAIRAIWERRGIRPKQHYSEGRRGGDKEQAVFQLYEIYGLHPVDPTVVRPPAAEETTQTKGRKSSKNHPVASNFG
ncbi:UV-endonuclease UvdE [Dimargaris cristalligena]|uniref:UV-endonuclease UvdE n=1 Tax=Dimargaris cristalligena TaxID=215637 RepID=A0A4P9ZPF6_9FUNG|nr:UV-endonuclease UvdE [Dimargaris cristalligena]|eukprot:RKP34230.1 UV-endonuclease UvdE [Dimargaris cristalligena]